jgi:cobalt-zinc-cadmium efflux system outer membrane protein
MMAAVVLTLWSLAAPVQAPLTLDEVLTIFRSQGFDLLMAEAEVLGSKGDARAAGAWANPLVAASVSHAGRPYRASLCQGGQCSNTGFTFNVTDQAGIVDVLSGKHHLRARAAQLATDAAQHTLSDAQRQLEAAVKMQFLAVALDQAEVDFCAQATRSYQEGLALFADRYQAGDISEADLTRVEVDALAAEQRQDRARASLEDDRAALALLMGYRDEVPTLTVAAPEVSEGPAAQLIALPETRYVAIAESHRPDLLALGRLRDSAQAALRLAERSRLPDATLNFNYQQFGVGQNAIQPRTFTGGLTLALPVLYQQQGEILRAQANARIAALRLDKTRALVRADVHRAYTALRFAYARSERSKNQLMTRAAKALELVRLQYTKGAASLLDLLDAQRTFSQVNLEHLATLGDFWGALIGLEQALAADVHL